MLILNQIRKHSLTVGYVILCVGVAIAITLAMVAINRVTVKNNATRCSVLSLVTKLTDNTSRSAKATLLSPSATAAQKDAAKKNLQTIVALFDTTDDALGHPHGPACIPPSLLPGP